jgi:predicted ATPase
VKTGGGPEWDVTDLQLPRTVRDAIVARLDRMPARLVVDIAAVLGTRASYSALEAVSGFAAPALVAAIDELRRDRILVDAEAVDGVHYDFTHPTLQATLYSELGKARTRFLHGQIAEALERMHGAAAELHADELAFHFSRAASAELAEKAARYLASAGRSALTRYATREAATYLGAALDIVDGSASSGAGAPAPNDVATLVEDLARAKQRNGEYAAARTLWERALAHARVHGDAARISSIERRLGLVSFWAGQHHEAFAHYAAGLEAASTTGDERLAARIRIAQAAAFQELGRADDALRELGEALAIAERLKNAGMLARIHRALMQLNMFVGRAAEARAHGERSRLPVRPRTRPEGLRTGYAVLAGLTGNAGAGPPRQRRNASPRNRSPVLAAGRARSDRTPVVLVTVRDRLAERTILIAARSAPTRVAPAWSGRVIHPGRGESRRRKRCRELASVADVERGRSM